MIYYIDAFRECFHHPKEDQYLFQLLRVRLPDAAPLLDRLKLEHRAGAEKNALKGVRQMPSHGGNPDLTDLPGHELVVNCDHDEEVYVALRDGFASLTARLKDVARRQHGQVRAHEFTG